MIFLEEKIDRNYLYYYLLYFMAIILSIPYIFTTIIFLMILFVISIPFNFLPFRVFAGFLNGSHRAYEMCICCCFCCFIYDDD